MQHLYSQQLWELAQDQHAKRLQAAQQLSLLRQIKKPTTQPQTNPIASFVGDKVRLQKLRSLWGLVEMAVNGLGQHPKNVIFERRNR